MVYALKLGDYLSVQAHKPCSISHIYSILYVVVLGQNQPNKQRIVSQIVMQNKSRLVQRLTEIVKSDVKLDFTGCKTGAFPSSKTIRKI